MRMLSFSILAVLVAAGSVRAESADQQVRDAIKAPDLTVSICGRRGAPIARRS